MLKAINGFFVKGLLKEYFFIFYMKKILVIGDLNYDLIYEGIVIGQNNDIKPYRVAGGSGLNAAIEFKKAGYSPFLIGKVGDDVYGRCLLEKIESERLDSFIIVDKINPTCVCNIFYLSDKQLGRTIFFDNKNTNDYDLKQLDNIMNEFASIENGYIYLTLYLFVHYQYNMNKCAEYINALKKSKLKIIVDIVPHNLHLHVSKDDLDFLFDEGVYAVVGEYNTFIGLMGDFNKRSDGYCPSYEDYFDISKRYKAEYYICRFGEHNISYQTIYYRAGDELIFIERDKDTGYQRLEDVTRRRGYGEYLTTKALQVLKKNKYTEGGDGCYY